MGGASGKLWFIQELENGQSLLLFMLYLLKNSEQLKSNVPKHTLKVFWVTTLVTKKKLSKKLLKWTNLVLQKGTKEPSFPWDLGLLFGKPMRYALFLQNLNL